MTEQSLTIGRSTVGADNAVFIIAEIGINHNGSLENAKNLIDVAVASGCDAVKFQKRTVEVVYTAAELATPRESVFGTTNGDLKRGLEFDEAAYREIDLHCKANNIDWFASCWDESSVDFMEAFAPPCYKIASASLTDDELLRHHRKTDRPIILSTGMSDLPMIEHAVDVLGENDLVILHCTSTYPSQPEELNLRAIMTLRERFPSVPIGYSGHEPGLATTLAAVAVGACVIERHVTLDRAMWGSDQAASVEPQGIQRLSRDIRSGETALGDGNIKIYDSERPIIDKLRRGG